MMASALVVETSVNTNNSPSQDYATNPDDHSNHKIHKVLRRFFHGVKCPGYRDLNKCQIPSHLGLNSYQMPGGCPGGGNGHSWI